MEKEIADFALPPQGIIYGIAAVMAGFILPVLLIPIVQVAGHSEIVEESAKALIVLFVVLKLPSHKMQIFVGIIFGFLFSLSENFLYLNQIFQLGDVSVFWHRFLFTTPMHIVTVLIMVFSGLAHRWLLVFGFIAAIILHLTFNGLAL